MKALATVTFIVEVSEDHCRELMEEDAETYPNLVSIAEETIRLALADALEEEKEVRFISVDSISVQTA